MTKEAAMPAGNATDEACAGTGGGVDPMGLKVGDRGD